MGTSEGAFLELRQITKNFGNFTAVDKVDLRISEGEFFTLVGPSGSGKTTMIRLLVGMDQPTSGDILLKGARLNDVPANKRPTCMVFQNLALFPHRSVGENIEFPLKIAGMAPAKRRERAEQLLKQLRLPLDYYSKGVNQCSGGERQRIALARALAFDPDILFFDEPLSALDFRLRKTLEKELKDIHRETGKTFVYITHSLEEAMIMSDRIGVMHNGRLAQIGTPYDIYTRPQSRFVTEFMGEVNALPVVLKDDGTLYCELLGQSLLAPEQRPPGFSAGTLTVRPEDVRVLDDDGDDANANAISGEVFNEYLLGSRVQYQIRCQGQTFLLERLRESAAPLARQAQVRIGWNPNDALLFAD